MRKVLYMLDLALAAILLLSSCSDNESLEAGKFKCVFDALDWGKGTTTYVVGHKSPDTDAVCSAITYAYLMKALGYQCEARVAGKLNNETKMVLERFGIEVPEVMDNADGERMIMTDHSELLQAIEGMDKARILQIIDHHALGSAVTSAPLYCRIMPVGSTCSVVYTSFKDYGVTIGKDMAGLMLSALLSDTNNMTSTTTTDVDRMMYAELLPLSGITDTESYYREMSDSLASYSGMTDEEIFFSDYKDYGTESVGKDIGVAVVNSLDEAAQASLRNRMAKFMPTALEKRKREMVFAMIINKTDNYTDIIYYGDGAKETAEKAFGTSDKDYIRCEGQLSRKNDFIPAISKALTEMTNTLDIEESSSLASATKSGIVGELTD